MTSPHPYNLAISALLQAYHEGQRDFAYARLPGARLDRTTLTTIDLSHADMSACGLERADLSHATLRSARLSDAVLAHANLSNALLAEADLTGADLSDANLTRADLSGADLSRATLARADAAFADLAGAQLSGCDLSGTTLTGADLSRTDLTGRDLSRARLSGANLTASHLVSADLSRADLSRANLSQARLREADLSQAMLSGANLSQARLSRARLPRDGLQRGYLPHADLSHTNLASRDLSDANLSGASLIGALLSRSNLSGADLTGADLTGADLTGATLGDLRYDARTRWPEGFDPSAGPAQRAPRADAFGRGLDPALDRRPHGRFSAPQAPTHTATASGAAQPLRLRAPLWHAPLHARPWWARALLRDARRGGSRWLDSQRAAWLVAQDDRLSVEHNTGAPPNASLNLTAPFHTRLSVWLESATHARVCASISPARGGQLGAALVSDTNTVRLHVWLPQTATSDLLPLQHTEGDWLDPADFQIVWGMLDAYAQLHGAPFPRDLLRLSPRG